jgi:hypothetical protein
MGFWLLFRCTELDKVILDNSGSFDPVDESGMI